MTALLVAFGAAIGAPLRYLTDRAIQSRHDSVFPWGTWAVNVAGSFLLGLLAALAMSIHLASATQSLVGVGFCGALTTYSTFGYETVRLVDEGGWFYACANVVASVVAGLGAAYCGFMMAGLA